MNCEFINYYLGIVCTIELYLLTCFVSNADVEFITGDIVQIINDIDYCTRCTCVPGVLVYSVYPVYPV